MSKRRDKVAKAVRQREKIADMVAKNRESGNHPMSGLPEWAKKRTTVKKRR